MHSVQVYHSGGRVITNGFGRGVGVGGVQFQIYRDMLRIYFIQKEPTCAKSAANQKPSKHHIWWRLENLTLLPTSVNPEMTKSQWNRIGYFTRVQLRDWGLLKRSLQMVRGSRYQVSETLAKLRSRCQVNGCDSSWGGSSPRTLVGQQKPTSPHTVARYCSLLRRPLLQFLEMHFPARWSNSCEWSVGFIISQDICVWGV